MIRWTKEGDTLKNGLNVYRLNDPGSIGFKFRWNDDLWMVRYSKKAKRMFIKHVKTGEAPKWATL